jgi:hypothetical protein
VSADLTTRYLSACLAARTVVAGCPLHPFTLGHAHLLAAATQWRPWGDSFLPGEVPTALWICSRPWRKAARSMHRVPSDWVWRTAWRMRKAGALARTCLEFGQWIDRSMQAPEVRIRQSAGVPAQARHCVNAPLLARLRLFATCDLGLQEPFDMLVGELLWLWLSFAENEGGLNLVDENGIEFREWCEEQDRLNGVEHKN